MVCATRVSHMRSGTLAFDSKAALIHNLAVTLSVSLSSSVVIVMSSASTATTPTISAAGPSTSSATTIPADLQASIQAAVQAAVADAMARLPPPPPPPPVSSVPGQYLLAQSCMWAPELRPRPLPRWPRQGRVRILLLGGRAVLRVLLASAAWPGRQCWFSHTAFPPLSLSLSLSRSLSLSLPLFLPLSTPPSLSPSLSLSLSLSLSNCRGVNGCLYLSGVSSLPVYHRGAGPQPKVLPHFLGSPPHQY